MTSTDVHRLAPDGVTDAPAEASTGADDSFLAHARAIPPFVSFVTASSFRRLRRRFERYDLVELAEQLSELPEALSADGIGPFVLDVAHGVTDDRDQGPASVRQDDSPCSAVVRISIPREVAGSLELAQEVVERLLGDSHSGREVGRPHPFRPRPEEDTQLRIARGAVHHFENIGAEDATALALVTLGLLGPAYFRELAAIMNVDGPPDFEAALEVMRRHGLTPATGSR